MKSNNLSRRGGVTGAILALILLILVAMATIWLVPSLRTQIFGRDAKLPDQVAFISTAPMAGAPATESAKPVSGTITAVRAKVDLPTYCLIDLGEATQVTVGAKLDAMHAGQAIATLLVESLTDDSHGATCRIVTGATPVVGDTVTIKP